MISIDSQEYQSYGTTRFDFSGTAGDVPPTGTWNGQKIANGSVYVNWRTGEMYRYDAPTQTWELFGGDG